jgi:hypothetical protein
VRDNDIEATKSEDILDGHRMRVGSKPKKIVRKTKTVTLNYLTDRNIEIIVKDTQNLNEYSATVTFDQAYLPKLLSWIQKRRFCVNEQASDDKILLRVDIFSFELKLRQAGGDLASMIQELRSVRAERESIMRDIKLFNFFFLNVFNETEFKNSKSQGALCKIPQNQIDKYVENPDQLFVTKEALAVY